jgi:hypothetical protein
MSDRTSSRMHGSSALAARAFHDGPAFAQVAGMQRTLYSTALLFAASILIAACASKTPPPKSTTTTNTQTSTTTGSSTNEKTQTTKTESPKP